MPPYRPDPTPDDVLALQHPTDGFLCPLSANPGIDFLKFEIRDYESGAVVYQSPTEPPEADTFDPQDYEAAMRSVRYTFPADFLGFQTIRTALEFKVGEQPLNNFRMIELHFFKGQVVRVYDFTFGFCIPNSINTWEAIYDVPQMARALIEDYIDSPFEHKSDSFYFVDDQLVMHNKASYQYIRT